MSDFLATSGRWLPLALVPFALVFAVVRTWSARRRARNRLFGGEDIDPTAFAESESSSGWSSTLERRLFVSGFRAPNALPTFLSLQAICLVVGGLLTIGLISSRMLATGQEWLLEIPAARHAEPVAVRHGL